MSQICLGAGGRQGGPGQLIIEGQQHVVQYDKLYGATDSVYYSVKPK